MIRVGEKAGLMFLDLEQIPVLIGIINAVSAVLD